MPHKLSRMRVRHPVWLLSILCSATAAAQPADPTPPAASEPAPAPPLPSPPANLPPPGHASDPTAVAGFDHGLYLATQDDAFRLTLSTWIQMRWELAHRGDDVDQRFSIPTGRIRLGGHAFGTTDFLISGEGGSGTFGLLDAFVDRPFVLGARVRVGQFRPYFAREQLTDVVDLELTDRSVTAAFSGVTRDLGVSLHREPTREHCGIEWALGVFNGNGIGATRLEAGRPLAVARVGWTSARVDGYSQGDLQNGEPRLAIAIAYAGDLGHFDTARMIHQLTIDAVFKASGFALSGAGFARNEPLLAGRETNYGWYGQAGYLLVPRLLELVARYGQTALPDAKQRELLGGLDVYHRGDHALKLQLEGGVTRLVGDTELDWVMRAQTQLAF